MTTHNEIKTGHYKRKKALFNGILKERNDSELKGK